MAFTPSGVESLWGASLGPDIIHPGQRLRVGPATGNASSSGKSYRVARGDTLGKIAERHGVGLSKLLRANGLSSRSTIYPGQELVIPD